MTMTAVAPASVAALTNSTTEELLDQVAPSSSRNDLILMPAGFFGNVIGGFAKAIGGGIGALAGNEKLGQQIGGAASPFIKMLPWSVVPAGVGPQSVGPDGQVGGPAEDLIFVPAGMVGDLLSGFAGAIGYGAGGLLGNKELGEKVGEAAAPFLKMLPWSVIPAEVSPQGATPDGVAAAGPGQDMIFVPAGIFGSILSGFAGVIGQGVGALAGNPTLGRQVGETASPFLKMLPWSVVPAGITPQSVVPGDKPVEGPDEDLMLVPAGIFGSILGGLGGKLAGGAIGGFFGNKKLGEQIGAAVGGVGGGFFPFAVVPVLSA